MSSRSEILGALRHLVPRLPKHETEIVLDHAMDRPQLRNATPENAAWLSLVAYVRHTMTDYDELLDSGYDLESARHFVLEEMQAILDGWGARRPIVGEDLAG
jgi:hypothetical protein